MLEVYQILKKTLFYWFIKIANELFARFTDSAYRNNNKWIKLGKIHLILNINFRVEIEPAFNTGELYNVEDMNKHICVFTF